MRSVCRAFAALAIVAAILTGNLAVCAAWQSSAVERLACCGQEPACPMHPSPAHHSHAMGRTAQTDADTCCAASEPRRQAPTTATFSLPAPMMLGQSALSLIVPALAAPLGSTSADPPRSTSTVPRHLLLSVFLV